MWPLFSSELIGGTPSLKINHGSGTLVLQLTNNIGVADRRWHRLDVKINQKVSTIMRLHVNLSLSLCMKQTYEDSNSSSTVQYTRTLAHAAVVTSFPLSPQIKGSALHSRSMFHRDCHGDRRRGLMGNDRGPLVLWNPRGHTQQGQVRSIIKLNKSYQLCTI